MEIRLLLLKEQILKNMRECIIQPILKSCEENSNRQTCKEEFGKRNMLQIVNDTTDQNSWKEGNWWKDEPRRRSRRDDCCSEDFLNTAKRLRFKESSSMSLDLQASSSEVSLTPQPDLSHPPPCTGGSLDQAAAALGSSRGWRLHFNIIILRRVGFTNALLGIDAVKRSLRGKTARRWHLGGPKIRDV